MGEAVGDEDNIQQCQLTVYHHLTVNLANHNEPSKSEEESVANQNESDKGEEESMETDADAPPISQWVTFVSRCLGCLSNQLSTKEADNQETIEWILTTITGILKVSIKALEFCFLKYLILFSKMNPFLPVLFLKCNFCMIIITLVILVLQIPFC